MEVLRQMRISKGLTMKQLGEMTDVTESTIGMIETGKRKPSFELLLKLCEVFDCSADELIYDNKKTATGIGDGNDPISEKDRRFIQWFHSLSPEKQKAILISQDAPEDLL